MKRTYFDPAVWPARAVTKALEVCADDGPYVALASAIIVQAANDYESALSPVVHRPEEVWAKQSVLVELEHFFRSNWYRTLTTIDGEYLMRRLREEVMNGAR